MSVPTSVEDLIQLIRKSGMLDEQKLSGYLQRRQLTSGLPSDVSEFAGEMVRDGLLTHFQSEQFLLGKWRGFTIGKFKLLERIGVGGMGQVFLCEHMFMKKRLAMKVLPPKMANQPAAVGRFYREARAAAALEHPNVVRTHDIDQDGNLHFIVMDYIDGPNLLEVVKKFGQMEIARAVSYVRQTANALDFAFRNKIIHRDVKPGNILMDRKGVARLLDMGLARFLNDHTDQLTLKYDDKIVLGTADYVAPEQVANSHSVDIRADIYALGSTLYFLLAGHPPFPTGTVSQKLLWHRTKEPTHIRAIRPEVPDGLAAVLAKMMAKDPKARYQTPAQVVAALGEWIPAIVPLPKPEEMPQLSLAARQVLGPGSEIAAEPVVQQAAIETVRAATSAPTAVLHQLKVTVPDMPANPFGPSNGSPWGSADGESQQAPPPARNPSPAPRAGIDMPEAPTEPTPSTARRNPFHAANPFSGGDSGTAKKSSSWLLIACGVLAVIAITVLLVIKT
jgi:serine/threonine protein kinase